MTFRAYHDNVLIELEPLAERTQGGLVIPDMGHSDARRKAVAVRWARVLAVGPGHIPGCRKCGGERKGAFVPTTVKVGDRVLVGSLSGYDYSADVRGRRQRDRTEAFAEVEAAGASGELRVVREDEILAVDDGSEA